VTQSTDRAIELVDQIQELEGELAALVEEQEQHHGYRWVGGQPRFSRESLRDHVQQRTHLVRYLLESRLAVLLTSPIIYSCLLPLLLSDLALTIYQAVCLPIYGIPKVRRTEYLVMDRSKLKYLNLLERLNCFYCSYANGLLAYEQEIVGRTEQHWCPIKHAKAIKDPHSRYGRFLNFGAAQDYRRRIETLRRDFSDLEHDGEKNHLKRLNRKEGRGQC
jgi:hypothetical protein